jgi:hypothetical protein
MLFVTVAMEDAVSRKPIGERAMTDVERHRRSRERRGIGGPHRLFPAPWLGGSPETPMHGTRREAAIVDLLYCWLAEGDAAEVAEWLAFAIEARDDGAAILDTARRRIGEREAGEGRAGTEAAGGA